MENTTNVTTKFAEVSQSPITGSYICDEVDQDVIKYEWTNKEVEWRMRLPECVRPF